MQVNGTSITGTQPASSHGVTHVKQTLALPWKVNKMSDEAFPDVSGQPMRVVRRESRNDETTLPHLQEVSSCLVSKEMDYVKCCLPVSEVLDSGHSSSQAMDEYFQ